MELAGTSHDVVSFIFMDFHYFFYWTEIQFTTSIYVPFTAFPTYIPDSGEEKLHKKFFMTKIDQYISLNDIPIMAKTIYKRKGDVGTIFIYKHMFYNKKT